jgi:hypothetical protein
MAEAVRAPEGLVPVVLSFDPHLRAISDTCGRHVAVPELGSGRRRAR